MTSSWDHFERAFCHRLLLTFMYMVATRKLLSVAMATDSNFHVAIIYQISHNRIPSGKCCHNCLNASSFINLLWCGARLSVTTMLQCLIAARKHRHFSSIKAALKKNDVMSYVTTKISTITSEFCEFAKPHCITSKLCSCQSKISCQ